MESFALEVKKYFEEKVDRKDRFGICCSYIVRSGAYIPVQQNAKRISKCTWKVPCQFGRSDTYWRGITPHILEDKLTKLVQME